jgi:hypothetical protein
MISRRSFLSALCALPFVGKFLPKPAPEYPNFYPMAMNPMGPVYYNAGSWPSFVPFATLPSNITDMITVDGHLCVMCSTDGRAYVVSEDGSYEEITRPPSRS